MEFIEFIRWIYLLSSLIEFTRWIGLLDSDMELVELIEFTHWVCSLSSLIAFAQTKCLNLSWVVPMKDRLADRMALQKKFQVRLTTEPSFWRTYEKSTKSLTKSSPLFSEVTAIFTEYYSAVFTPNSVLKSHFRCCQKATFHIWIIAANSQNIHCRNPPAGILLRRLVKAPTICSVHENVANGPSKFCFFQNPIWLNG